MENEIAFARTQGAFTLPNPLAVVKDEGKTNTHAGQHACMHTHSVCIHTQCTMSHYLNLLWLKHPHYSTDSKTKPLYLTPDEMSEFEEKQKI